MSADVADATGPIEPVNSLEQAIQNVLKKALVHDGVIRGLHQVAKALEASKPGDEHGVRVCFLAKSCTEAGYSLLVKALCEQSSTPLVEVENAKQLGQWAGLCEIDKNQEARKIVGAGCVAVTDFGEESSSLTYLLDHIASRKTSAQA